MTQDQFFARYRYDIENDFIGGGGFGKVYKAYDVILDRYVAIKVSELKSGFENLSLKKEVELAASLPVHRNIAYYEVCYRFKSPNGIYDYGILQYYSLGNLSQLVKKNRLNESEKEGIAKGIISGIHHLHNNNVVHRDLKSSNILMAKGLQGEYNPKIADFGLSKQFYENVNTNISNSSNAGSLLYMSPEQLEGKNLRKNVDLWALGILLYELFIGETPFKATESVGTETARADVMTKIKNAKLPPAINSIQGKWQELIRVCLVSDPMLRIASIEDVISLMSNGEGLKPPKATDFQPAIKPHEYSIPRWLYYVIFGALLTVSIIYGMKSFTEVDDTNLIVHEKNGYYGYKDDNGNVIIPAQYEMATLFVGGKAKVRVADSIYYIDKSGTMIELVKAQDNIKAMDEKAWQEAIRTDRITGYENYVEGYPSGRYVSDAFIRIRELKEEAQKESDRIREEKVWQEAMSDNSKSAFERYVKVYPSGLYVAAARSSILEIEIKERENEQQRQSALRMSAQRAADEIERTMVQIAGGKFRMGCTSGQGGNCNSNEKPIHDVTLSSYSINKYEVTQEQWKLIMGYNPSWQKCDRCPVTNVSWYDIQGFIKKLNEISGLKYRLPTEAEWEFAARGGEDLQYPGSNTLDLVSWYKENSSDKIHFVGQKSPNRFRLYDMSGNVWEWCSDWYGSYTSEFKNNPQGAVTGDKRICRGGSKSSNDWNCRVANRHSDVPEKGFSDVGFRLAL
jgi:formylglycine-generating enzyme required for sulfatase activity/serine/threonine protein kinase